MRELRKATAATIADWKAKDELPRVPPPASALDQAGAKVSRVDMIRTAKQAVEHKRVNGLRQNVDTRIKTLKASLDVDLAYCRNLLASRRHDKAIALMRHIIRKHDDMLKLADRWNAILASEIATEINRRTRIENTREFGKVTVGAEADAPRKPGVKVERKVKRHKRFSDN